MDENGGDSVVGTVVDIVSEGEAEVAGSVETMTFQVSMGYSTVITSGPDDAGTVLIPVSVTKYVDVSETTMSRFSTE